jgi:hypothetical protein
MVGFLVPNRADFVTLSVALRTEGGHRAFQNDTAVENSPTGLDSPTRLRFIVP